MNKKELTKSMAARLSITQRTSMRFINTLQEIVTEQLTQNETVMLQGFGCFSPWEQSKRPGRNPRNGTSCIIEARTSVKFKPGRDLLGQLNPEK